MNIDQTYLALIPAKLKSRRLKQKNIIKIKGKPLIYWTLFNARKSLYLTDIFVSTESNKISQLVKKNNFKVIKRPRYLSKDSVNPVQVLVHSINKIKKNFDYIVLLQTTSPLRTSYYIDKAIKKIFLTKKNSLVSIYKSKNKGKFPIKRDKKGFYYNINGAIYICKTSLLLKKKKLVYKNTHLFEMPKKISVDVDNYNDLYKVKKLLKY